MDRTSAACQNATHPDQPPADRLIPLKEVMAICGKSKTSVYGAIKSGDFPRPVKFGLRTSRWVESEVYRWVQRCIENQRTQ